MGFKSIVFDPAHQEVSSYLLFTGDALDAPTASMAGSATCRPSSGVPASYKVVSNPLQTLARQNPLPLAPPPDLEKPEPPIAMASPFA